MNRRFCGILAFFLICALSPTKGQNLSAFADAKLYDAVLDRLFQHEVLPRSPEIQLRYTYCDTGEMQVIVHKLSNADFQLDIWHVPVGVPNVWNQLAQLARLNPTVNADNASTMVKMSHKMVVAHNSTVLAKLFEEANSLPIPLLNQSTVALDGMAYGIAVRSISEDLTLTLQGPQHADKSDNQLIQWMGKVRSNIEPAMKEN
jgi:hypothetical protein